MPVRTRLLSLLAVVLVPAVAAAAPIVRHRRTARVEAKHADSLPGACLRASRCSPAASPSTEVPAAALAPRLAPAVRRLDASVVERLEHIVEHFRTVRGEAPRVVLLSAHRSHRAGARRARSHAVDFRLDGVKADALLAFCKTLPDTGCGGAPHRRFVHMDVHPPKAQELASAGRTSDPPRAVSSEAALPELPAAAAHEARDDRPALSIDEHVHAL